MASGPLQWYASSKSKANASDVPGVFQAYLRAGWTILACFTIEAAGTTALIYVVAAIEARSTPTDPNP